MKTKQEVLKSFMKANKQRREKMANNAGFDSAADFKAHLEKGAARETRNTAPKKKVESKEKQKQLDFVIAFDTTGSMASYISAVKNKAVQTVGEMFKNINDLRIGIVAFGDYCDMNGKNDFGKAYQVLEPTNDQEKIVNFIKNAKNTRGGDGDEFYELVIKKINNETPWRDGAQKSVLLIADADPHEVGYSYGTVVKNNQINWRDEAMDAANIGITYDTFRIHERTRWMQELSKITNGLSLPFKSAKKTNDVIEGLSYRRAGASEAYATKTMAMMDSGDEELIGTFKTISTLDD